MKKGDRVELIKLEGSLVQNSVLLKSKGTILGDKSNNAIKIKFDNKTVDWFWVNLDCVKLIENTMQTLTRKQLIKLHSEFDCTEWKIAIEELLKENVFKDEINVSSKLELLKSKGTEKQKEAVRKLKITLLKSYSELHNECGLKKGDKVRVMRKATNKENGWCNIWTSSMDDYIGKVFKIESSEDVLGFGLKDKILLHFPYFVLEKVEEKYVPYTFEDGLIGKAIKSKEEKFTSIIIWTTSDYVNVSGRGSISYFDLLENYTELDGSPLGKLVKV